MVIIGNDLPADAGGAGEPSFVVKVVRVDPVHLVGGVGRNANAVVDHELCESRSGDQDHLGVDACRRSPWLREKTSDVVMKTPLRARFPQQGTRESLNLRAADRVLPALGLDVDDVQTKAVLP